MMYLLSSTKSVVYASSFTTDDGISSPWRQLEITRECKRLLENTRHHRASNWDYTRTSVVQVDCCSIPAWQPSPAPHNTLFGRVQNALHSSVNHFTDHDGMVYSGTTVFWTRLDQKMYRMSSFQGWIYTDKVCLEGEVSWPQEFGTEGFHCMPSTITYYVKRCGYCYVFIRTLVYYTLSDHKCHHASWPLTVPQHIFTTWSRHNHN